MSRLKDLYKNEIMDAMTKKFGYKNVMEVPKLEKIVVNMGVGEAKENAKLLDAAIADMELVTGQKAIATKAKKSVANFKIREGMPIGSLPIRDINLSSLLRLSERAHALSVFSLKAI